MIKDLLTKILLKLNGDEFMMALFLAQRITLGKLTFEQVPSTLKAQVYEHLVDSGLGHLAGDYTPPVTP